MNKEDLIFELKKRCSFWLNNKTISKKHALECLLGILENEETQPSLPSDIDEAAEKAYKEYDVKTAVKPKEHPVGFLFFDGFKVGAEWMAGQGVSVDGKVVMDFSEPYDIINRRLIAKLGDALLKVEPGEVIVQIRKKQ